MKINLVRISFIYLFMPFLIFSIGFLKPMYAIPILALSIWTGKIVWNLSKEEQGLKVNSKKQILIGIAVVLFWVVLSGIGGFAFQNSDFHGRNAIFRDLVEMKWPVYYPSGQNPKGFSLVYYIGFWLPAALIGKLFGWATANIALYLWTCFGVVIAVLLLSQLTKLNLLKTLLLLIFFSGMDLLGVLSLSFTNPFYTHPSLWPPIQHLEWWTDNFQFSSFTTQLFWVFNQAIPAWICTAIIFSLRNFKLMPLFVSFCLFFSPLPAIGLVIITIPQIMEKFAVEYPSGAAKNSIQKNFSNVIFWIKQNCSPGILIFSLIVIIISYLYFSTNSSSTQHYIFKFDLYRTLIFMLFVIVEWLLLWVILLKGHEKQILRYVVAATLLLSPLIRLADSDIFGRRVTIPAFVLLLIWTGQSLSANKIRKNIILILILFVGSFTPLWEINRSIYRTFMWYKSPTELHESAVMGDDLADLPSFPNRPEHDHPDSLLADDWHTLSAFKPEQMGNWLGKTTSSLFFKFLAK